MIIYKATNQINNKIYIGQTIKPLEARANEHKYDSKRNNYAFPNAIKKYGFENFTWEIIETCSSQEELDNSEIKWIKYFDSTNNQIGYNIAQGGNPGKDIGRENLSNLWKTQEFRDKMKQATRKGAQKLTEEQVAQIKLYYSIGIPIRVLTRYYNITHSGIEGICYNHTWKDIEKANDVDSDLLKVFENIEIQLQKELQEKTKNIIFDDDSKQYVAKRAKQTRMKLTIEQIAKLKYLKDIGATARLGSELFYISFSLVKKIFESVKYPEIPKCKEEDFTLEELQFYKEKIQESIEKRKESQLKGLQAGWNRSRNKN